MLVHKIKTKGKIDKMEEIPMTQCGEYDSIHSYGDKPPTAKLLKWYIEHGRSLAV